MKTILLLLMIACATAINPIVIKGRKFFDGVTGNQFYVVGVDYQPSEDPIADVTGLQRDIPYMRTLGINAIRCYQTNPKLNHDQGMQLLADAGIYVFIDVSDPNYSIESSNPSWTDSLFTFMRSKVDSFAKYTNLLGYIAGNEVILAPNTTPAAPFIKAGIRDLKAYIKSKGYNKYVGYAATDVPANDYLQPFLDCNTPEESADFFGLNIYRWCGDANFQSSGYAAYVQQYANYRIPIIWTEYGCNQPSPRKFNEVKSIYGPDMDEVLSGGLVYEWHQEANEYGLVVINSATSLTLLPDYNNLKAQLQSINPKRININNYNPTGQLQSCPQTNAANGWPIVSSPLPPTPNQPACNCMFQQLQCRSTTGDQSTIAGNDAVKKQIGDALNFLCGSNPAYCAAIGTNSASATYGQWSTCSSLERLSWAMNQYYLANNRAQGSCDFGGLGSVYTPTVPASTQCQNTPNDFLSAPITTGPASTAATTGPASTVATTGAVPSTGSSSTGSGNSANCPSTLSACGGACYNPSQYCCPNGQLVQISFCQGQATSRTPVLTSSSTVASSAAPSTTAGGSPSTGSGNTANCPSTLSACGEACYNPSQYCCPNGQLVQIDFCGQQPTRGNVPANTPSSTTGNAPATSKSVDCRNMFAGLRCRTKSEDPAQLDAQAVANARNWLCGAYPSTCTEIGNNGMYSSCNSVEQVSYAMNQYYATFGPQQGGDACNFGGIGQVVGKKRWLSKF